MNKKVSFGTAAAVVGAGIFLFFTTSGILGGFLYMFFGDLLGMGYTVFFFVGAIVPYLVLVALMQDILPEHLDDDNSNGRDGRM